MNRRTPPLTRQQSVAASGLLGLLEIVLLVAGLVWLGSQFVR